MHLRDACEGLRVSSNWGPRLQDVREPVFSHCLLDASSCAIYMRIDQKTPMFFFLVRTEYESRFGVTALWSRKTAEGRAEVSRKVMCYHGMKLYSCTTRVQKSCAA